MKSVFIIVLTIFVLKTVSTRKVNTDKTSENTQNAGIKKLDANHALSLETKAVNANEISASNWKINVNSANQRIRGKISKLHNHGGHYNHGHHGHHHHHGHHNHHGNHGYQRYPHSGYNNNYNPYQDRHTFQNNYHKLPPFQLPNYPYNQYPFSNQYRYPNQYPFNNHYHYQYPFQSEINYSG